MTGLMKEVRKWLHDDQGVTSVEYAVMLALILVAIFSAINGVGDTTQSYFDGNAATITAAVGG